MLRNKDLFMRFIPRGKRDERLYFLLVSFSLIFIFPSTEYYNARANITVRKSICDHADDVSICLCCSASQVSCIHASDDSIFDHMNYFRPVLGIHLHACQYFFRNMWFSNFECQWHFKHKRNIFLSDLTGIHAASKYPLLKLKTTRLLFIFYLVEI